MRGDMVSQRRTAAGNTQEQWRPGGERPFTLRNALFCSQGQIDF
jgi:hypothetical protein